MNETFRVVKAAAPAGQAGITQELVALPTFAIASVSTGLWTPSAFTPIRDFLGHFIADIRAAARRSAAAAYALE